MSKNRAIRNISLALAVVVLLALPLSLAQAANNSEQVVFSGAGAGDFGPFGFWVWCESDSHNPYTGLCSGSIYIYALRLVKHVTGTISEGAPDAYTMTVSSSDGSVACTLTNTPPVTHGPSNTVSMNCTAPSGGGTVTNAVVNVTGPG